ncbi:MAG: OmpA family protein [Bacteroidales bacterium]|nr:OmpA family protein [Bacteroidales bacterium]
MALITITTSLSAISLHSKNKKAIQYYNLAKGSMNTNDRISLLNKAIQKDSKFVEAYWALAEEWVRIDSTQQAINTLLRAKQNQTPEQAKTQMIIAEVQMMSNDFESALATLNNITDNAYEKHCKTLKNRCQQSLDLINNPVAFAPINLTAINTDKDDYFPSITSDGMSISTTVADRTLRGNAQEDLYWSYMKDGEWQKSQPLTQLNTDGNEGSQSFSADGRYMFYVACDRRESDGGCDIYYSIREGNKWSVPINPGAPLNTTYWESNPVLSPAGNELFYVTNRDGQSDIWHCDVVIEENGRLKFKNPRSLGSPVNTNKDEYAPFIHADNKTLYFASSGHNSLGKNDIFFSKRENGKWSKPENIGYPINTVNDEMSFVVTASGDKAYFASNKLKGEAKDYDIYEIELPEKARPKSMRYIKGKIIDKETLEPLAAFIEIFDNDGKTKIFESQSDKSNGTFTAFLPTDGYFGIDARKKGYLFYTDRINAQEDTIVITLQPVKEGKSIILNNLYFATNSATIESRSFSDIQHLYELMLQNNNIKIHIIGHTDNTGTQALNKQLSNDRANALKEALLKLGIKEERITTEGKGSDEPIDTNDTEEGRARNRRVEIKIETIRQ